MIQYSSSSNVNNGLTELQEDSTDSLSNFKVLEDTLNQENLKYVNNLIKETEKHSFTRPKSTHCKPSIQYPSKINPVKVSINLNSNIETINENDLKAQKLFDNFFKFKNSQDQKINENYDLQKTFSAGDIKKRLSDSNSSKETQNTKHNMNSAAFLKSIDEYLGYLNTNEKENATAYFSVENDRKNYKELLKENSSLKSEIKNLKLRNEKYENKWRETANTKKIFLQEYNLLKRKEEENSNLVKVLQHEIHKMKNLVENLKFKLKVTQESLIKEKIEAENSMIALKRVLIK